MSPLSSWTDHMMVDSCAVRAAIFATGCALTLVIALGEQAHAESLEVASNALVKYLSEGREMEIVLAPVAGTRLLAQFRLSVVSMLANLV